MNTLLEVKQLYKSYGSVQALDDVSFEIHNNEIVGLVGDNGAGKTTLINILSGNFPPDDGKVYLEGKEVHFKSPLEARKMGIETVYQNLSICENLDSISNLFIGREIKKSVLGLGFLAKKKMASETDDVMKKIGIHIPSLKENVEFLSGGQRQAVSIGRFVAWGSKLVLLDEPTSAMGVRETAKVLDLISELRNEKKVAILFISHNLQHILKVADRIIVIRLGKIVGVRDTKSTNPDEIVGLVTGATLVKQAKKERR